MKNLKSYHKHVKNVIHNHSNFFRICSFSVAADRPIFGNLVNSYAACGDLPGAERALTAMAEVFEFCLNLKSYNCSQAVKLQ